MIVPMMALGASGVISVFANICPGICRDMTHSFLDGNVARARELQLKYLDLINALFIEVNPIPIKTALNLAGQDMGGLRLPLCEMTPANLARLRASMERMGLIA